MMTGQDQQVFVDELRDGCTQARARRPRAARRRRRRRASSPSDDEVDDEIERLAARLEQKPAKVRKDLERSGAIEAVRSDIARGKAVRFLVDHAEVVDEEGNPVDLTLPESEPRRERSTEDADIADAEPPEAPTEEPQE